MKYQGTYRFPLRSQDRLACKSDGPSGRQCCVSWIMVLSYHHKLRHLKPAYNPPGIYHNQGPNASYNGNIPVEIDHMTWINRSSVLAWSGP